MNEKIRIKPEYKVRPPHRPTKVHKNKRKYTRKIEKKTIKDFLSEVENEKGN